MFDPDEPTLIMGVTTMNRATADSAIVKLVNNGTLKVEDSP